MKKIFLSFILILSINSPLLAGTGNNTNEQPTSVVLTYTVTIPYINEPVILEGTVDIMNQAYGLKAKPKTSALHVGDIAELKSFEIGLSNKDGFTLTGVVQLLREEATLSLQALSKKQMALTFSFDPVIRIPLSIVLNTFPDIVLPELDLTITNEPRQFTLATSGASAFNKQVQLTLSGTRNAVSGTIKVPGNITITNFMPEAIAGPIRGTAPDKVALQDITVQINNFLKKKTGDEKFSATVTGKMDFSQLTLPGNLNEIVKKPLELKGTINQTEGAVFTASLPTNVTLPGIAQISIPHLYVNYNPFKKVNEKAAVTVGLGGTASITLPARLGSFDMDLEADYKENKFIFAGTLKKKLNLKIFSIDNAQVTIADGDYEISGKTTISNQFLDLDVIADVTIKKDGTRTASATVATKELKPFEKTGIPYVKDISLQNPVITWAEGGGESDFTITGDSKILDTEVKLAVSLVDSKGMIGKAEIKKEKWKLPSPASKIPGVGALELTNPIFVVSTLDNYTDKTDTRLKNVPKGLSVYAEVPVNKYPLKLIGMLTKKDTMELYGTLSDQIQDISFAVGFCLPDMSLLTNICIDLKITGQPQFFGFKGSFDLEKIDGLTSQAIRNLIIEIGAAKAQTRLAFGMHDVVKDPFVFIPVKGVTISNIDGAIDFVPGPEPVSGFAFQGTLAIDTDYLKKQGKIGIQISAEDFPIVYFAFDEFGLQDFIGLLNAMGAKIPKGTIPNLGLKDVEFSFAPGGGKIGETVYKKGTSMGGKLELFGPTAEVNADFPLKLSPSDGVSFSGTLDKPIEFGPLSITAATDPNKGPSTSVKLTPLEQEVSLDGKMKFFVIEGEAQGTLGISTASFTTSSKLGDVADVMLTATITTVGKPDAHVAGVLDIETSKILKEIEDKINSLLLGPALSGFKKALQTIAPVLDRFVPTQALGKSMDNIISASKDFADAAQAVQRGDIAGASNSLNKVIINMGEAAGKAIVNVGKKIGEGIAGLFHKKHRPAPPPPQIISFNITDLFTALKNIFELTQNKDIFNTMVISDDPKVPKTSIGGLFTEMQNHYQNIVKAAPTDIVCLNGLITNRQRGGYELAYGKTQSTCPPYPQIVHQDAPRWPYQVNWSTCCTATDAEIIAYLKTIPFVPDGNALDDTIIYFKIYSNQDLMTIIKPLNDAYDFFNRSLSAIQNTFYSQTQQKYQNLANVVAALKQLNAPPVNIPPLPPATTQQKGAFESLADKFPDHLPLPPIGLDVAISFEGSPTDIKTKLTFSIKPFVSNVTISIDVPIEKIVKDPASFVSTLPEIIWNAAKDGIKKSLHL